ncbi:hypothetical protein PR048_028562 [Dryococelus australis]|uniref:Mutator-like transposase domain-containing protein n=1 Tax=Dryococelus australis TaxID=614101 RepID=A0ABQ9GB01_9NEOP|nr:hypothetical protein PR048_028562 [Dryococelus australis]
MEADIADGFLQSEKLLGLKFNKLIGEILTVCKPVDYTNFVLMLTVDGDSSVHRKLLETMPYGPNLMVEQVEFKNHVLRNYCHKLSDITKNTKFPVTSRNILKQQIPRFRTAVEKAIKYRAAGNEPLNTRLCMLKASHCYVYFCNGNKAGEINHVPELKSCGLLQEIMKIIFGIISRHVSSLRADQNNNLLELSNSIVNKLVAGKCINYALRGQYKTRSAAAVSFYNVGEYKRVIHKTMMGGNSPGESTTEQNEPESAIIASKLDEKNYNFLAGLVLTVLQSSCHLWNRERRKLLTASNFGSVCKMRATTFCKNLVHSILYGNFSTKSTRYGIANEPVAKRNMAEEHGIVTIECDLSLFVDSEYPVLGATPVKCPLAADKYGSPKEAVDNGQVNTFSHIYVMYSTFVLPMQGQLHMTGRKYCYFVVYASRWMTYEVIEKDDEFWSDRMAQSFWSDRMAQSLFYKECLLEELVNPQFSKRFVKADIKDPIYITTAQQKAKSATRKRPDI